MASDGVRANTPARSAPSDAILADDVILRTSSTETNGLKEPRHDNATPLPRIDSPGKSTDAYSLQSPASITSDWDVQVNEKLRPMPDLANEKFSASLTQADYQASVHSSQRSRQHMAPSGTTCAAQQIPRLLQRRLANPQDGNI
jgi:hypothetical protein